MIEDSIISQSRDGYSEGTDDKNQVSIRSITWIRTSRTRWFALLLACLSCIGAYFSSELPQALQPVIMERLDINLLEFNVIYSIYSLPNIILPFLSGFLIDRLGVRLSLVLFAILVIIGQGIMTYGAFKFNFTLLLIGRAVFASGGDCIVIAKSTIIAKWFIGKELSFALGAGICIAKLGSSLASFMGPQIYKWHGSSEIYQSFLAGIFLCVLSLISILILNLIDKRADIQEKNISQSAILTEKASFRDIRSFRVIYYLLLINSVFVYSGLYGLTNNINHLLVKRFGFNMVHAGRIVPIIYVCPIVVSPLVGILIDKKGKKPLILIISCLGLLCIHFLLAYLPESKQKDPNYNIIWVLLGIGCFYAIFVATYWPCIAFVVKPHMIGIAYGLVFSVQNLALVVVPLVIGKVNGDTYEYFHGYFWTEIVLAGLAAVGFFFSVGVFFEDRRRGSRLGKSRLNNRGSRAY